MGRMADLRRARLDDAAAVASGFLDPSCRRYGPRQHRAFISLRAWLAHVCDGQPVPANLAALGAVAINAFACMTERVHIVEMQPRRLTGRSTDPRDAIPF